MSKKLTTEEFIKRAKEIHGEKYDYSKVEYVNNHTKVCIICPKHGEFWQIPSNHLNTNRPRGCPFCGIETTNLKNTYSKEKFIEKAKLKHKNKYDYSKVVYEKSNEKICIICPEHGEFWQTPASHLMGYGCPYCSGNAKLNTKTFIEKAKEIHGDKYDYSKVYYINSQTPVLITCPEHGDFWQIPNNHLSKEYSCPKCNSTASKKEKEIVEFIKTLTNEEIIENDKNIINPFEIDIYIPKLSLAIEFDGLRWHSENFCEDKKYHLKKTLECEKKGIRLIHIFEDEWDFKKEIIKDIIERIVNVNFNKIFARNCDIKLTPSNEARTFINENHLQSYVNSNINIGLYYNEELVSLMCFGKKRINLGNKSTDNHFELLRYCTKKGTTIIGGASKIFNYFIKTYNPENVISYSDNRLFLGKIYEKLGFSLKHVSPPNYFYVIGRKRENRFKFRKDILVKEGYDKNKTEHEIMLERGIYRIYDCGCKVWEYKKRDL
jgi:hypothetical protein